MTDLDLGCSLLKGMQPNWAKKQEIWKEKREYNMCENEKLWIGVNVDSQSVLTANHRQTARCMKHSGNVLQKDWQHALKGTVMDYPPPYTHTHNFTHLVELLYSPDEQWVTGGVFKVNIICREEKKKEKKESSRQWWCRVYSSAPGVLSSRELQAICYIGELKAEELPGTRITYCCKK